MTNDARIRGREDLEAYVGHFNAKRYDQQIAYYHPEVVYKVGSVTLTSPEAIKDFYADFHTYSKEHVSIFDFAMTGDRVAVSLPSVFEPFRRLREERLVVQGRLEDRDRLLRLLLPEGRQDLAHPRRPLQRPVLGLPGELSASPNPLILAKAGTLVFSVSYSCDVSTAQIRRPKNAWVPAFAG
ncbi:MAG: nuclear transport factor 2 family protein [Caulobacteraceae bacterium]